MNHLNMLRTLGVAALMLTTLSSAAQNTPNDRKPDPIANHAPSDRTMKDVRTIRLTKTINADLADPASDIYTNWTHDTWSVEGHVAANYKIDLRGFHMPTTSRVVTSNYGPRWGRRHQGLDIKVYTGDTIRAAFDGKVRVVTCQGLRKGYGYYIVIRHPNGLETLYGHLSKQLVKEDQIVRAGDVIGLGGNTGRSTGSHLHFETRLLGQPIDPRTMFDFPNQDVTGDFYVARTGAITRGNITSENINMMDEATRSREGQVLVSNAPESATASEQAENAQVQQPANNSRSRNSSNQRSASYRVKSGDNLYNIAKRNGTTVSKLCKLNGISEKSVLRLGQVLKIS